MKRKRLTNEIRFRVSKKDLERIDYILKDQDDTTISALLRTLIQQEYGRRMTVEHDRKKLDKIRKEFTEIKTHGG